MKNTVEETHCALSEEFYYSYFYFVKSKLLKWSRGEDTCATPSFIATNFIKEKIFVKRLYIPPACTFPALASNWTVEILYYEVQMFKTVNWMKQDMCPINNLLWIFLKFNDMIQDKSQLNQIFLTGRKITISHIQFASTSNEE